MWGHDSHRSRRRLLRLTFAMPWHRTVWGEGSHFLPAACRLERTGPDACSSNGTTDPLVRTPKTDVVHLTRARDAWVVGWVTTAQRKNVLESRYVISRIEQNTRLLFP